MDQRAEDIARSATADFKARIEDGGEEATVANPHQLSLYDMYAPRSAPLTLTPRLGPQTQSLN